MTIKSRVKNIETQLSIDDKLMDAETCRIFGVEYGKATIADGRVIYADVLKAPQSHPKFLIKKRIQNQ